jgi:hypothetical protein
MSDRAEMAVDLKPGQREFLEQMAKEYGLPDLGKVVRCLVNYARDSPDQRADIFAESRCLDC